MVAVSSNWLALKASGLNLTKSALRKEPLVNRKTSKRTIIGLNQKYVALDCEMVEGESVEHMLARVSIVDYEGRVLYDAFVKPRENVTDYRTGITGITKEMLHRKGEPFQFVRSKVIELLKDKIIVGHAVHHDFEALELQQPENKMLRDTCLYAALRPPNRKQTPSLRLLAEYWLDKVVQTGSHSSIEDARTAMCLFKRFKDQWESAMN